MESDWQPDAFDMIRIDLMIDQEFTKDQIIEWFENDKDTNLDKDYFKKLTQWIEDNLEKHSP